MKPATQLPRLPPDEGCRVCGEKNSRVMARRRSRFSGIPFTLFECPDCSFQFVEPKIDPKAMYTDDYYEGRGAETRIAYRSEYESLAIAHRRFEFADYVRIAESHFRENEALISELAWLDFGCGAGGLLRFLRETGEIHLPTHRAPIRATGFEPSGYADFLRAEDYPILSESDLAATQLERFDVITCIEVLEHTLDPVELLRSLSRLLKPGGLLILTTGNMHAPLARILGFHHPYHRPEIHISLFNPELLREIYSEVGLQAKSFTYRSAIRAKILKVLRPGPRFLRFISTIAHWRCVQRPLDWLFGVSAIPCATKPNRI